MVVELYNERINFNMEETNMQKDKDMAMLRVGKGIVKKDTPDTLGISGDIFNYMPPLCLEYVHDACSDTNDETEESSREDSDGDNPPPEPWGGDDARIIHIL